MSENQSNNLMVEVSAGELIDKITILEIKQHKIRDNSKLLHIATELAGLVAARDGAIPASSELATLTGLLGDVNLALWEIEDDIREQECRQDFGARFIELARSVYQMNDRRAEIKRRINLLLKSRIVEAKEYTQYSGISTRPTND